MTTMTTTTTNKTL